MSENKFSYDPDKVRAVVEEVLRYSHLLDDTEIEFIYQVKNALDNNEELVPATFVYLSRITKTVRNKR